MKARRIGVRLWRSGELGSLQRATFELFLARARLVRIVPSDIAKLNARPVCRRSHHPRPAKNEIYRVAKCVSAMARFVPFRSDCLVQALAAQRWLGRLGIHTTIAIQVGRGIDQGFIAHAVLNHGRTCVLGKRAMDLVDLYSPSQGLE